MSSKARGAAEPVCAKSSRQQTASKHCQGRSSSGKWLLSGCPKNYTSALSHRWSYTSWQALAKMHGLTVFSIARSPWNSWSVSTLVTARSRIMTIMNGGPDSLRTNLHMCDYTHIRTSTWAQTRHSAWHVDTCPHTEGKRTTRMSSLCLQAAQVHTGCFTCSTPASSRVCCLESWPTRHILTSGSANVTAWGAGGRVQRSVLRHSKLSHCLQGLIIQGLFEFKPFHFRSSL